VGNLVYARVAETNKFLKTKITCISLTSKKVAFKLINNLYFEKK